MRKTRLISEKIINFAVGNNVLVNAVADIRLSHSVCQAVAPTIVSVSQETPTQVVMMWPY